MKSIQAEGNKVFISLVSPEEQCCFELKKLSMALSRGSGIILFYVVVSIVMITSIKIGGCNVIFCII